MSEGKCCLGAEGTGGWTGYEEGFVVDAGGEVLHNGEAFGEEIIWWRHFLKFWGGKKGSNVKERDFGIVEGAERE
jgi:hypothetical protein